MTLRKRIRELEARMDALEAEEADEPTHVGCDMPPRYKIKTARVDPHRIWREQVADHATAWGGDEATDDFWGYL